MYGVAQNCDTSKWSRSSIDLTGTQFAIETNVFTPVGCAGEGDALITNRDQVVKVKGHGYQGGVSPNGFHPAANRCSASMNFHWLDNAYADAYIPLGLLNTTNCQNKSNIESD